jgi:flagellar hook-associated protein 1 FlgK
MQSTFSGIELGKRGLNAHTQGLQTVGHNISNASTEGYSRQRVEMRATDPLYLPGLNREGTSGQIGQGVDVASIERVRDDILEGRIVAQANGEGYWETRDKYLLMAEKVYNEVSGVSVRGLMDQYWNGWQDLSLHPGEMASRQSVLQRGETLIDGIHERYQGLRRLRDMLEENVKVTVGEINGMTKDIAALNEQILKVKTMGDNPNDLLDRRDLLVEKLSKLINITVDRRDPDEQIVVHTGGFHLIQGRNAYAFSAVGDARNEGYSSVRWQSSGEEAQIKGGKLAGLLELRDMDVRKEMQGLDLMTINFIDLVNEVHRQGYGLNGKTNIDFFQEYPSINNLSGNYDRNGDGAYDSTYIFRITGSNKLNAQDLIGLEGELRLSGPKGEVAVAYRASDTVGDLVNRINTSGSELTARLDRDGRLNLRATPGADRDNPDFVIRHLEDSGQFLAGYSGLLRNSGREGAFDWGKADAILNLRGGGLSYAVAPLAHPSAWIEVNQAIKNEPASIAASFGEAGRPGNPGDGSAALALAALRNNPVMIGSATTFDNYFADVVAGIGLKGEQAKIALDTQHAIMKDLRDMRESLSGVNIDEELAQMIKYQQGYAATARFISELTKMLDTIINRVGA